MATIRAKFACQSVQRFAQNSNIVLEAVRPSTYRSPNDESPLSENEAFYALTPAGNITLQCVRPETAALFEPGKEYYLDFTPVE